MQDGAHDPGDGYVLVSANCDIIVHIEEDGLYGETEVAHELVRTLLPRDAILVGVWAFGNRDGSGAMPQDVEQWISGRLACRYRLLEEARGGSVPVVYNYDGVGIDLGPVKRIEPRSARLPRVLPTLRLSEAIGISTQRRRTHR